MEYCGLYCVLYTKYQYVVKRQERIHPQTAEGFNEYQRQIIGEPTSNQPSCYGEPLSFTMPNTGIRFKISHKQFFRPDANRDHEDSIYPDIEVYRKIDDVMNNRDIQMEALIKLIIEKYNKCKDKTSKE